LLLGLTARLPFLPDTEITMEANPGTIEHGRFAGYADAGINRVSLGAQSFEAATLALLGRIHGPEEIGAAARELASAGLHNFNLDLMYALPRQDLMRRRSPTSMPR
jgi:coproporphyrinogen III oxidase-like Fe-S oxidoreductase